MRREEIVGIIGREMRIEKMVRNISRKPLDADLEDLCQMVYETLMKYKDGIIEDLWENGEINFFLARIIKTQITSPRSGYHYLLHNKNKKKIDADIGDITGWLDGEDEI